jgi:hypothetical protein
MQGLRVLLGFVLLIVGGSIGFVGYQYEDTIKTEIVSKNEIVTKKIIGSNVKYYYTTTDNMQHQVDAATYIKIPQKGVWSHTTPTDTGNIIIIVGAVLAFVGLFIISPDLAFISLILEGCS